jgi:hypothetical protein
VSVISWYLIIYKSISQIVHRKRSNAFLELLWSATSLEAVQNRQPFTVAVAPSAA